MSQIESQLTRVVAGVVTPEAMSLTVNVAYDDNDYQLYGARLRVEGKEATVEDVLAFLARQDKPVMFGVRLHIDETTFALVQEADFYDMNPT